MKNASTALTVQLIDLALAIPEDVNGSQVGGSNVDVRCQQGLPLAIGGSSKDDFRRGLAVVDDAAMLFDEASALAVFRRQVPTSARAGALPLFLTVLDLSRDAEGLWLDVDRPVPLGRKLQQRQHCDTLCLFPVVFQLFFFFFLNNEDDSSKGNQPTSMKTSTKT